MHSLPSTITALILSSVTYASPFVDPLLKTPKLPVDPAFIRPAGLIPEIVTIPTETILEQVNRATSPLKAESFVGHLPGVAFENASISARGVIGGTDNRYQYTDRNYPFRTIGKLIQSNGAYCTAFIEGPRQIVAAKHCIPPSGVSVTFYPAIDNNNAPFGSFPVTTVVTNSYPRDSTSCDWEYDWAIFIVNDKVGNNLGYMGAKAPDAAQVGKQYLYNLGYPVDKDNGQRPYKQDGITALTQYENNSGFNCDSEPYVPLCSDQDTSPGQSGSPIWELVNNERYVWGVTSVTSNTNTAHGAGKLLVQFIIDARNNYP